MAHAMRWTDEQHQAWKDRHARGMAQRDGLAAASIRMPRSTGAMTLPWPPTGNHAVKHGNGGHYLTPEAQAYRAAVAAICEKHEPVRGRYRMTVHMAPPDGRRRDIDNALKSLFDAIVHGGYVEDDAMNYMRELVVSVGDERRGWVVVKASAL